MQTIILKSLKCPPQAPSSEYVLIPKEQFSVSLRRSGYNEESPDIIIINLLKYQFVYDNVDILAEDNYECR